MSDGCLDDEERKKLNEIIEMYLNDYSKLLNISREKLIEISKKEYGTNYEFLSEKNLIKALKKPTNHLIVVYYKNNIAGFCYFKEKEKYIYLEEIHVKEEYRKKHIGSKLLNIVEDFAKRKKAKKIMLESILSAVNFYIKNGYKIEKKDNDPNYVIMSKDIENEKSNKKKQLLKIKL